MVTTENPNALAPITGVVVYEEPADGNEQPQSGEGADYTLEHPYPVPSDEAFGGKEFVHAEDLTRLAAELRERYHADFWHLKDVRIAIYWKRRTASKSGKVSWFDTRRANPLEASEIGAEFIVWVAASYCREPAITLEKITAALIHSLLHIGWNDEKQEAKYRGHDFEGFKREIEICGYDWQPDLEAAADSFQMRFAVDDEENKTESDEGVCA